MLRWFGKILPPPRIIWIFSIFYGLFCIIEYLALSLNLDYPESDIPLRGCFVLLACASYAIFRVLNFHPACRPKYRQWLCAVPWTIQLPLPIGPVHLVLQDVLVMAVFSVLAMGTSDATPTTCLAVFLCTYILIISAVNAGTGNVKEAYITAFGFGLAARFSEYYIVWMSIIASLYVINLIGLKQSLRRFPWDTPLTKKLLNAVLELGFVQQKNLPRGVSSRLGYPYDALKYQSAEAMIPARHAILLSLLAAWLTYVASWSLSPTDKQSLTTIIFFTFPGLAALLRVIFYCGALWPPISILGRVATRQWIIPSYDHVFLAPLGALIFGLFAGLIAQQTHLPRELSSSIIVGGVLIITLLCGPTLGGWRLMGLHRTIEPIANTDLIKL